MRIGTKVIIRCEHKYKGATGIVASSPRWTEDGTVYDFYLPKHGCKITLFETDVDVVISWQIISCWLIACILIAIIGTLSHCIGYHTGQYNSYQSQHARLDSIQVIMHRQDSQYQRLIEQYDKLHKMLPEDAPD